jgi:hypothetical protein
VDYNKLNYVTKKDFFPLRRIDDTLDTLAGAKWFSNLDLKNGYWQFDVHPDNKKKTTISTGKELWHFTVMHFCLCNTPGTFKRLMETVLLGFPYDACLVYLDDMVIIGRIFQEHLLNLRNVSERFRETRLKLNPGKCELTQKKVEYLGCIVSPEGIFTDPEKLKAVREWPTL